MRFTVALCAIGAAGSVASASVVTFTGLGNGEILNTQFSAAPDNLTISAINPNRSHDLAAVFDSLLPSVPDPDLNGPPWAIGNLAPSTVLGNLMILSERDEDAGNPGFVLGPDDEGARPAGQIILDYSVAFTTFQIDVVDIEGNVEEFSSLEFYSGGALVGTVNFTDFGDNSSAFFDATVQFGNNSANRLPIITAADFSVANFDRVIINVGGSSGWDNISASGFIPAPGTIAFGLCGLGALARRRR